MVHIDTNDESMIRDMMNKVGYLTEQDIIRQNEQNRRVTIIEKKKMLQKLQNSYAREIRPDLH